MEKRVVAFGIVDSYNKPPTLLRDHQAPTSASRAKLHGQIAAFNRRQGAKRYSFATIFEDGTFDASYAPDAVSDWTVGIVKWFSPAKGFGFVLLGDGKEDVFVHATTLEECGVTDLQTGEPVSVQFGRTDKGLVAVKIGRATQPS